MEKQYLDLIGLSAFKNQIEKMVDSYVEGLKDGAKIDVVDDYWVTFSAIVNDDIDNSTGYRVHVDIINDYWVTFSVEND